VGLGRRRRAPRSVAGDERRKKILTRACWGYRCR
jgi:hypothetical protein